MGQSAAPGVLCIDNVGLSADFELAINTRCGDVHVAVLSKKVIV
jgi:hypothetical protein